LPVTTALRPDKVSIAEIKHPGPVSIQEENLINELSMYQ
jgi:hypothetical protein